MSDADTLTLKLDLYPKQLEALQSPAQEILFGGATRGGKSHFVRVMLIAWCLRVPGIQCLILRKVYDDVIANHMEGPSSFRQLLAPLIEAKRVVITADKVRFLFGRGQPDSLITLSHCGTEEAVLKAQGIPKDICVFEEACQIAERHIRFIRAWCTTTEEIKAKLPDGCRDQFPKIYYTANPIGASVGYFRRNFVKPAPKGTIFKAPDNDGGFMRQYIQARVQDNASEDTEATKRRVKGMGDEGYYKALIDADWDAPIGDYFKQYCDDIHSIVDHTPPAHCFKFLSFDWGSAEPFAVLWWYVSDGVEFRDGLNTIWTPRGCLVAYREWYGCDADDYAKGLHMSNADIAKGIIARTPEQTSGVVLTDSLPFQARGYAKNGREYRISDEFAADGVTLIRGNTQRVYGWKQVRDRLLGMDLGNDMREPMIRLQQQCKFTRDYLPMLGYSKTNVEDAEESGEATHCCDIVRLACASKPLIKDAPVTPPTVEQRLKQTASLTAGAIAKQLERKRRNARR